MRRPACAAIRSPPTRASFSPITTPNSPCSTPSISSGRSRSADNEVSIDTSQEHQDWHRGFAEPIIAVIAAGGRANDDDINLTGRAKMDAMRALLDPDRRHLRAAQAERSGISVSRLAMCSPPWLCSPASSASSSASSPATASRPSPPPSADRSTFSAAAPKSSSVRTAPPHHPRLHRRRSH